jgi:hypothetical protein
MVRKIEDLAILYHRILEGIATDDEKSVFDIGIKTSCIDEQIMMNLIKEKELNMRN